MINMKNATFEKINLKNSLELSIRLSSLVDN